MKQKLTKTDVLKWQLGGQLNNFSTINFNFAVNLESLYISTAYSKFYIHKVIIHLFKQELVEQDIL